MRNYSVLAVAVFLFFSLVMVPVQGQGSSVELLDPSAIPKWVNQLDGLPSVYVPVNITDGFGNVVRQEYVVNAAEFYQQILPTTDANGNPTGFGATKVWGYGGLAKDPGTGQYLGYVQNTPGPTFEATRNLPVRVQWVNNLVDASGQPLPYFIAVDPTLHWANPSNMTMHMEPVDAPTFPPGYPDAQSPAAIVTHLHGAEVPSTSDGHPDAWFTANGIHGPAYSTTVPTDLNAAVYDYPNTQEPTTLWYHDHALGVTRLSVLSGLAGFYLLKDSNDGISSLLPTGQYDVPLCIQDRIFQTDGSFYYPTNSSYPQIHPYWVDSFLGNTVMVNGKVWPNMNVNQGLYRFRLLDASNSRFYQFTFSNSMQFTQIGSDGGYLKSAVPLTSLLLGPAERADILVDFSNIPAGTKIVLLNTALTSSGETETIGQIMQFTVTGISGAVAEALPIELNPTLTGAFPTLQNVTKTRMLSLIEATDSAGTLAMYLDGQRWNAPISEDSEVGSTEEWVIANPTISAHPIHLHLVQFQIVSRQAFNDTAYMTDWLNLNGLPPLNHSTVNVPSLTPYLIGNATPAAPNEQGWKDTATMFAGEITVIRVRFTQQDASAYPFDVTVGPGYVWHCHLLEHEDNEMMRPYKLTAAEPSNAGLPQETLITIALVAVAVIAAIAAILVLKRKRRLC